MAIIFKKGGTVQPIAPKPSDDLLAQIGLAPKKPGIVIKRPFPSLSQGDKVRYTNPLFSWQEHIKPGDIGEVVRTHPAQKIASIDPVRDALVVIRLTSPRVEGKAEAVLARWECELVEA